MPLTKDDLRHFFHPNSIAIVGVSTGDSRFGGSSFLMKLQQGGFRGKLYPINPKSSEIQALKAYPDLISIPEVPDLAMVCVPARYVPSVLAECARIGLRHIHILTSGFKETGTDEGRNLEEQIAALSKEKGLLVIGPNCMGPYCPSSRLTAWGAIPGMSGPVGIISQSGGMTQRLTEYLFSLGIGVDKAVSFGNGAVLGSTDYLEAWAEDEKIRVIAMYLESVRDGRKFFALAKEVSREKPIILWKGGESEAGARTAASHTGALSGEKRLWDAFYKQTGVTRVRSMDAWVDAIMALAFLPAPKGRGVFVMGGGGGNSVAYSDTCIRQGLDVPNLSPVTIEKLRLSVPAAGSIAGNPLDMFRVFQDAAYLADVLNLAYEDPAVSMVMVDRLIHRKAFHLMDVPDTTPQVIEFLKSKPHRKPTVFTLDSEGGDPDLAQTGALIRAQFCRAGMPAFPNVKRAAKSLFQLYRYHRMKRGDEA